ATLRVRLRGEKRGEDDVPLGAVVRIPGVALLPARVVDLDVPLLRRLAGGQGYRTLYVAMLVERVDEGSGVDHVSEGPRREARVVDAQRKIRVLVHAALVDQVEPANLLDGAAVVVEHHAALTGVGDVVRVAVHFADVAELAA